MMMLAMVFSLSTMYAFSGEEAISKQALAAFKTEFAGATEAAWTAGSSYYKVAFTMNEQKLFAYYNVQGEFIAVTRYISSLQLPLNLQGSIKKLYGKYWISNLFEKADSEGTGYYLTLENADTIILLKSSDGIDWIEYQKNRKV